MNSVARHRHIAAIWAMLVAFSLLSAESVVIGSFGTWTFLLAIVLACAKAALIACEFMELAAAPRPWAIVFIGLIVIAGTAIAGLHLAVS